MTGHIFVSYSRKDSGMMHRVCNDLRAAGFDIWTDDSLQPGTPSWHISIEEALQNASSMVVILSPDAKQSEWVGREIQYAETQNKRIFPVLARGDERESVPISLIGTQRVNIQDHYHTGIQELIAALRVYGSPEVIPMPTSPPHKTVAAGAELNPFNFFDHLMLMWWLFFKPEALAAHGLRASDRSVRQTGAWLASSIVWLPFLAPALGMIIGTVRLPTATSQAALALLIAGFFGLICWLVSGWFGWRDNPRLGLVLMVIVGGFAFLLLVIGAKWGGIRLTVSGAATTNAFLLTTGVSLGIAAGIAFRLANAASGALGGVLIASIAYLTLSNTQPGVGGGLTGLMMVAVTFLVSAVIEQHFATGRRSRLSILVSLIVVANTAVMAWLYLLGGWGVLGG
jgi:hypothetical protein